MPGGLLAFAVYGLLAALAGGAWLLYLNQISPLQYIAQCDFMALYIGLRAVATGQGGQLYDLEVQRQIAAEARGPYDTTILLPFIYPGVAALPLAPLGLLPYGAAFVAWAALNLGLAGWSIRWLVRENTAPGPERNLALVAAVGFLPLLITLALGQFGILTLAALVGALRALRGGHEGQAKRPAGCCSAC